MDKEEKWCDEWHERVKYSIPRHMRRTFENPVIIEFWFDSRLDADGHSAIVKACIDTLVKEKILVNDSQKYVKGVAMWTFGEEKEKGKITVRVSEVNM